jgi:hypothetical protein
LCLSSVNKNIHDSSHRTKRQELPRLPLQCDGPHCCLTSSLNQTLAMSRMSTRTSMSRMSSRSLALPKQHRVSNRKRQQVMSNRRNRAGSGRWARTGGGQPREATRDTSGEGRHEQDERSLNRDINQRLAHRTPDGSALPLLRGTLPRLTHIVKSAFNHVADAHRLSRRNSARHHDNSNVSKEDSELGQGL